MLAVIFLILILDAILILGILWISANALYQHKRDIVSTLDARRLGNGMRILMVAPPLIVLAIAILSFFIAQNDFFTGFTHGFYLLALWLAIALLGFSYLLFARLKNALQFAAMLGFLGAIIPVLYFTPVNSFQTVIGQAGQVGYILPLVLGVVIIGVCYVVLLRLRRALR